MVSQAQGCLLGGRVKSCTSAWGGRTVWKEVLTQPLYLLSWGSAPQKSVPVVAGGTPGEYKLRARVRVCVSKHVRPHCSRPYSTRPSIISYPVRHHPLVSQLHSCSSDTKALLKISIQGETTTHSLPRCPPNPQPNRG